MVISRLYTRTDVHGIDEIIKKFLWYKTHWHLYIGTGLGSYCDVADLTTPDFQNVTATIKGLIFHWYWTLFMMKTLLTKNLSQKSTTCHQHNSSPQQPLLQSHILLQ